MFEVKPTTVGKVYKSFNELSQVEKQFYNLMQTSHGVAMLKKIQDEHNQMRVNCKALQAQRQAEFEKTLGNQAQANQQFIRNVGGVLSIVETGEAGEVTKMKALTQDIELEPI